MDKKTVDELLAETERRWSVVTEARREAAKAERKWRDALYEWYSQLALVGLRRAEE